MEKRISGHLLVFSEDMKGVYPVVVLGRRIWSWLPSLDPKWETHPDPPNPLPKQAWVGHCGCHCCLLMVAWV